MVFEQFWIFKMEPYLRRGWRRRLSVLVGWWRRTQGLLKSIRSSSRVEIGPSLSKKRRRGEKKKGNWRNPRFEIGWQVRRELGKNYFRELQVKRWRETSWQQKWRGENWRSKLASWITTGEDERPVEKRRELRIGEKWPSGCTAEVKRRDSSKWWCGKWWFGNFLTHQHRLRKLGCIQHYCW